jgi:hypothetical protein
MDALTEKVLAELNKIRANYNLPQLKDIEMGLRAISHKCPVARSLAKDGAFQRVTVGVHKMYIQIDEEALDEFLMSTSVSDFVAKFDRGEYPQYQESTPLLGDIK